MLLGNREGASPHLGNWEGLSGWLTDLTSYSFRAFRFATRYRVVGGAAAAGRKSNRFCSTTHESSASRAARLQVLAKLCPRPALTITSTAQCLLLGPHVLSKLGAHGAGFAQSAFLFPPGAATFLWAQPKEKWGRITPPTSPAADGAGRQTGRGSCCPGPWSA